MLHPDATSGGFDVEAFGRLAQLEPASFWFRSRNRLLVDTVTAIRPRPQSVLELGCGTGFVLSALSVALPGCRVTGAELFSEGLAVARARLPAIPLLQLDARRLPFEDHFDVIGAFDVLEHIDQDETTLARIHRALRPGGRVVLTVPQHRWLWSAADEFAHHERRYTRRELKGKLARAGFTVERITSFVTLLLPLMALSRLHERTRSRDYEPSREFTATERVGDVLEALLGFERALIRRGATLPFGGSLLAVGRIA